MRMASFFFSTNVAQWGSSSTCGDLSSTKSIWMHRFTTRKDLHQDKQGHIYRYRPLSSFIHLKRQVHKRKDMTIDQICMMIQAELLDEKVLPKPDAPLKAKTKTLLWSRLDPCSGAGGTWTVWFNKRHAVDRGRFWPDKAQHSAHLHRALAVLMLTFASISFTTGSTWEKHQEGLDMCWLCLVEVLCTCRIF